MHPIDDSFPAVTKPRTSAIPSNAEVVVSVQESSQVGEARRAAAAMATQLQFDETQAGALAIMVTELANNLVRHAAGGQGEIHLRPVATSGGSGGGHGEPAAVGSGIEVLSMDRGSGIANVNAALRDGFTTSRTPGTGLGAVQRLSSGFDLFSGAGRGVVLMARVWPGAAPASGRFEVGAVSVPVRGETVCGDAWCVVEQGDRALALVADGLGHGPIAAEASQLAVTTFREHTSRTPQQIVEQLHAALRPTRGAAVAVAEIDTARGRIAFCGVGNIAATVVDREGKARSLVSHNGTVGAEARRIVQMDSAWTPGALLLLSSDGLTTRWQLSDYPGLLTRQPSIVAGVIYRDHRRGRDDATILAIRGPIGAKGSR